MVKKKSKKIEDKAEVIESIGDMEEEGVKVEFSTLGLKPLEGKLMSTDKNGVMIRFKSRGKWNYCYSPYANIKTIICKKAAGDDEVEEEEEE